jgi:phytoene synthase
MGPGARREPVVTDRVVELSRDMIAEGSRSFAVASRLLSPETRHGAWMLYAWCRHCDDRVDDQSLGRGGPAGARDAPRERLDELRERTRAAVAGETVDEPVFLALQRVVQRYRIPEHHPMELLDGFAMDVAGHRYVDLDDTLRYGYHVAGVVGVMMAHVMGVREPSAFLRAADLGIALQLTNIARDVMDDASVGRVYLPQRWLEEAGVPPEEIAAPRHRRTVFEVTRRLLDEAERYYASGTQGIRSLSLRSAWAVATARGVYRDIGRVVRARGEAAWDERAFVGTGRKLILAGRALVEALAAVTVARHRPTSPRENLWTHGDVSRTRDSGTP